jgi:hypothetical protein
MDNLDNKTPVQPELGDLQAQYDALRHMLVSLMVLVVVMSGTFNIYLLRQWRSTSKDLTAIRPQATQMVAEFQKVSGPVMQDFVRKITDYGRTHPDFAPVLAKYGLKPITPTNPPSALPTTTAPKK